MILLRTTRFDCLSISPFTICIEEAFLKPLNKPKRLGIQQVFKAIVGRVGLGIGIILHHLALVPHHPLDNPMLSDHPCLSRSNVGDIISSNAYQESIFWKAQSSQIRPECSSITLKHDKHVSCLNLALFVFVPLPKLFLLHGSRSFRCWCTNC